MALSDRSNLRILVSLATYNERENLPALVDQIHARVPEADMLVIDDSSPDGTGQWCLEASQHLPGLRCIIRSGKLGLGTAAVAGFAYAIEHGYDLLVTMDADFSHSPESIPALIAAAEGGCDVAVGSRYIPGGRIVGWPWQRRLMSRAVNALARHLLRLPTRDSSGQFRCYRVDCLRQLDLEQIRSKGFSVVEEILWRLKQQGASFQEVPIVFVDRARGASKLRPLEAIRAMRILIWLAWIEWMGGPSGRRNSGKPPIANRSPASSKATLPTGRP